MKKTQVLLINDNRLLREGAVAVLNQHDDIRAVAVSLTDGSTKQSKPFKPQVILLDLGFSNDDGMHWLHGVRSRYPDGKVIVMGVTAESSKLRDYVRAGVAGIILRHADIQDFVNAIRAVAGGLTVFPGVASMSLFDHPSAGAAGGTSGHRSVRMTRREKEVIALIATGMTNKEIASELNIALHTVKSHVHNLLDRLSLRTRLDLANYALKREPPEDGPITRLASSRHRKD